MKKITLFALLLNSVLAVSAFAEETDIDFNSLLSADEIAVDNESVDMDLNDWRRREHFTCFAKNTYDRRFEATGRDARDTQFQAVRECRLHSGHRSHCRPMGCHRSGGR